MFCQVLNDIIVLKMSAYIYHLLVFRQDVSGSIFSQARKILNSWFWFKSCFDIKVGKIYLTCFFFFLQKINTGEWGSHACFGSINKYG